MVGGGHKGGFGGQWCHRPTMGTHQLHSRQHLQEGDEVVAVSQIFIEVVDVLAHLWREVEGETSEPQPHVHFTWLFQNYYSISIAKESSPMLPK